MRAVRIVVAARRPEKPLFESVTCSAQSSTSLRLGPKATARRSDSRRTLLGRVGSGVLLCSGVLISGAVGGAAVMAASSAGDPNALVRSGMSKFRSNDVEGSLEDFDAALAARPAIRPFLWQRGLSLYYLGEFAEGAQQFRDDVAVNPNDTEESIWAFLCEARLLGPDDARQQFLEVGRDPRPVMRAAYECFKTGAQPEAILQAAGQDQQGHDAFYSRLYAALWHEAQGDAQAAQTFMTEAVHTGYAQKSGDYMAALASVHCKRRGWLA